MLANRGAVAGGDIGNGTGGGSRGGGGPGGRDTGSDEPVGISPTGSRAQPIGGGAGLPAGSNRGTGQPNWAPTGGKAKNFELTDLEPQTEEIGSRSWEDPSRFGGLEHRRDKTKASGTSSGTGSPAAPGTKSTAPSATNPRAESPPVKNAAVSDAEPADDAPPARVVPTPRPTPVRPTSRPRTSPPPDDPEQRLARGPRRGNGQDIPYEQLQRRRWGQFEEGANIGVEKSVTIRVDAEQMIVANQLIIPIRPGASRNELFDHLLAAIDEHSTSWGPAATGFFWIPSLKFVISPGGNQIYDRIGPLVTRSGLRADTEFTLEKPDSPRQGGRP